MSISMKDGEKVVQILIWELGCNRALKLARRLQEVKGNRSYQTTLNRIITALKKESRHGYKETHSL